MAEFKDFFVEDTGFLKLPTGNSLERPEEKDNVSTYSTIVRYNNELDDIEYEENKESFFREEYLYYDEGDNAALWRQNWNNSSIFTMEEFGGLGKVTAHGYIPNYNWTICFKDLPKHTHVKYQVYWHMTHALDSEVSYVFMTYDPSTEDGDIIAQFNNSSTNPNIQTVIDTGSVEWVHPRFYSSFGGDGNGITSNGYLIINSGWRQHSIDKLNISNHTGADQAQSDEATYLSHVKLWLKNTEVIIPRRNRWSFVSKKEIFIGTYKEFPAKSGWEIKQKNPLAKDGVYWIKPTGYTGEPFQVYCDMTTDGGGWVLIDNEGVGAKITSRTAGAVLDLSVTKGCILPAYDWSDNPQLMVKSSYYNGFLPWRTFNVISNRGRTYPTVVDVNSGEGELNGDFSYAKDNGNSQEGTGSWIFVSSGSGGRIGTIWIGSIESASAALSYRGNNTGLGIFSSSLDVTGSSWVR